MADLSKLVFYSPSPAFRNFESGELQITYSGTLLAPTGASATTLSVSGSTTFPQEPAIVNFFVSQDVGPNQSQVGVNYAVGDLLRMPPYQTVFCNVNANADGYLAYEVVPNLVISGDTLTITMTSFNAGAASVNLTFVSTVFTFRYIAYLPTGTV